MTWKNPGFMDIGSELEQILDDMQGKLELLRQIDSLYLDHSFESRLEDLQTRLNATARERKELEESLDDLVDSLSVASADRIVSRMHMRRH